MAGREVERGRPLEDRGPGVLRGEGRGVTKEPVSWPSPSWLDVQRLQQPARGGTPVLDPAHIRLAQHQLVQRMSRAPFNTIFDISSLRDGPAGSLSPPFNRRETSSLLSLSGRRLGHGAGQLSTSAPAARYASATCSSGA